MALWPSRMLCSRGAGGTVNQPPVRTAGTVANQTVLEDSGTTSLGLSTDAYSPAPRMRPGRLTYQVTRVPAATLGQIHLADGTTLVTAGESSADPAPGDGVSHRD